MEEDRYEAFEDQEQQQWRVEYISSTSGECFVTIFSGPEARERAEDYAKWKNGE